MRESRLGRECLQAKCWGVRPVASSSTCIAPLCARMRERAFAGQGCGVLCRSVCDGVRTVRICVDFCSRRAVMGLLPVEIAQ